MVLGEAREARGERLYLNDQKGDDGTTEDRRRCQSVSCAHSECSLTDTDNDNTHRRDVSNSCQSSGPMAWVRCHGPLCKRLYGFRK